jgi:serine/threonine protein phosphatase PrpC
MHIHSEGRSITGRRQNNEDNLLLAPKLGLYLVADGMGGYHGGEVASALVVQTFEEFFQETARDPDMTWPLSQDRDRALVPNLIRAAVALAHQRIQDQRQGEYNSMGSTVALVVVRDDHAYLGHVGDSRIYRLRGQTLERMTRDHSLIEEFRQHSPDMLTDEAIARYSNVITRAVGFSLNHAKYPPPDLREETLAPGDTFLLCSDGLTERLDDDHLRALLLDTPPERLAETLVQRAYDQGARDNITAITLRAA